MKKHVREAVRGWEALGCKVREVAGKRKNGHHHFELTLPSGGIKRVPMAGSPTCAKNAVRCAIRQIQHAMDGKDRNL